MGSPLGPMQLHGEPIGSPWGPLGAHGVPLGAHGVYEEAIWGPMGCHGGPWGTLYQQTPDQPPKRLLCYTKINVMVI